MPKKRAPRHFAFPVNSTARSSRTLALQVAADATTLEQALQAYRRDARSIHGTSCYHAISWRTRSFRAYLTHFTREIEASWAVRAGWLFDHEPRGINGLRPYPDLILARWAARGFGVAPSRGAHLGLAPIMLPCGNGPCRRPYSRTVSTMTPYRFSPMIRVPMSSPTPW